MSEIKKSISDIDDFIPQGKMVVQGEYMLSSQNKSVTTTFKFYTEDKKNDIFIGLFGARFGAWKYGMCPIDKALKVQVEKSVWIKMTDSGFTICNGGGGRGFSFLTTKEAVLELVSYAELMGCEKSIATTIRGEIERQFKIYIALLTEDKCYRIVDDRTLQVFSSDKNNHLTISRDIGQILRLSYIASGKRIREEVIGNYVYMDTSWQQEKGQPRIEKCHKKGIYKFDQIFGRSQDRIRQEKFGVVYRRALKRILKDSPSKITGHETFMLANFIHSEIEKYGESVSFDEVFGPIIDV